MPPTLIWEGGWLEPQPSPGMEDLQGNWEPPVQVPGDSSSSSRQRQVRMSSKARTRSPGKQPLSRAQSCQNFGLILPLPLPQSPPLASLLSHLQQVIVCSHAGSTPARRIKSTLSASEKRFSPDEQQTESSTESPRMLVTNTLAQGAHTLAVSPWNSLCSIDTANTADTQGQTPKMECDRVYTGDHTLAV
jgi:hypothetical protein